MKCLLCNNRTVVRERPIPGWAECLTCGTEYSRFILSQLDEERKSSIEVQKEKTIKTSYLNLVKN